MQNNNTLILKQIEGSKSLYYTLTSIIATEIIIVFSPLKILVDD